MGEFQQVWQYIENAGVASAGLLLIIVWWLKRDLDSVRTRLDQIQDKRIEDAQKAIEVISNNTNETRTLIELVKALPRG